MIRKQGGPPKNPRDGDRIPAALDHALDRNLDPNEVYHYGIYAIYAMPDGRLFPAPGVVVSARPQPPISALEAPRLLLEPSGRVRIDWIEPPRGSVKILRTAQPLPVRSRHPAHGPPGRGARRPLDRAGSSRSSERPRAPAEGHCYYTPLTVWGDTLDSRAQRGLQPGGRPVRASRDPRPGSGLGSPVRRHAAHASLAVGRGSRRHPGRRPPGRASQGPNDPAAITATFSARLRSPGLLDAQLADRRTFRRLGRSDPASARLQTCHLTAAPGTSGFTASSTWTASARSRRAWSRPQPRSCRAHTRR